jgi:hypothetical protein
MRARVATLIAVAAATFLPGSAVAISPTTAATPIVTTQAAAADAGFLAYAPPPAGGAGALCLVDTGVNVNPDTQPGLVSATAIDGGTANDVDPVGHGTTMAMIAGAAGHGMIGAWPQIKIVSVRATAIPTPGQEPTFEFSYYVRAMDICSTLGSSYHIDAIDLALSSTIAPSPDQAQAFASEVARAGGQNIAVVAAAGNAPGPIEQPAAQPGVLAVGAGDPSKGICPFSASQGLTFYAPGCGIDEADPFTDQPTCCGNGTSQASAFAAAVLVALMSYDPTLGYAKAEQLLVSTAVDGHLDATAAFQAAGLGTIVTEGTANIPKPPSSGPAPTSSHPSAPGLTVKTARWHKGLLTLVVSGLGTARLSIQLDYPRGRTRRITTGSQRLQIRTAKPLVVLLRPVTGKHASGKAITVHVT